MHKTPPEPDPRDDGTPGPQPVPEREEPGQPVPIEEPDTAGQPDSQGRAGSDRSSA